MSASASPRIDALKLLLVSEPGNALIRYMLANEYMKAQDHAKALEELAIYLAAADDEGAGYRLQATACLALGLDEEARESYRRGIEAANRHNHPSMVSEFESAIGDLS